MKDKICFLMIFLVISLTFYTADVYAGINEMNTHGIDNIYDSREGYRRAANDQGIVQILAEFSDKSPVTKDNLRLGEYPNWVAFQECTKEPLSDKYRCSFVNSVDFNAGKHEFIVRLFSNTAPTQFTTAVDEVSGVLYADNLGPLVVVKEVKAENGNISVTYDVLDKACDNVECEGKCAGILKVEFPGADPAYTEWINTSDCTITNLHSSVRIPGTGLKSLTMVAYDRINQQTSVDAPAIFIDTNVPVIADSFDIKADGKRLGFVSTAAPDRVITGVNIAVTVTEENISQAYADLRELNGVASGYERKEAVCTQENGEYTCRWSGLNLVIQSLRPAINVTVIDTSGNIASKEIKTDLLIDNTAPIVTFLGTDNCKEDECFLSPEYNTIVARIAEVESGFNQNYSLSGGTKSGRSMVLDMTEILGFGIQNQRVFADECEQRGTEWYCYWNNVTLLESFRSRAQFRIHVVTGSRDDAQNPVTGIQSTVLYFDNVKPVVEDIQVISITEHSPVPGKLIGGRHVSAVAVVNDELPVTGYADFSEVITDLPIVQGECVYEDNKTLCLWDDVGIAQSVTPERILPSRVIDFRFVDGVGNEQRNSTLVDILYEDGAPANYWTPGEIAASPGMIDRQLMPLVPQRLFFKVTLAKTGVDDVRPLRVELEGCDGGDSDKISALGFVQGKDDQWINIELAPHTVEEDRIGYTFDCRLKTVSVVRDKIVTSPEIDNVSLTIDFYDSKLLLGDSINQEIENVKNDVIVKLTDSGVFGTIIKIMDVYETICRVVQLVTTINQIYQSVSALFDAFRGFPGGASTANAQQIMQRDFSGKNLIHIEKLNKFCSFLSCNNKYNWCLDEVKKVTSNGVNRPSIIKASSHSDTFSFLGRISRYSSDPKESLAMSICTWCIPGIVYNLRKYRKIQCSYVDCLKNKVAQGTPMSICKYEKDYATCRFVWGEIFSLVPFAGGLKKAMSQMFYAISHPVSLIVGEGLRELQDRCVHHKFGTNAMAATCAFVFIVPTIKKLTEDLKSYADKSTWKIDDSICEVLKDDE